jgi:glycosyltransferase involved in cell wall biosynthesis
VDLIPDFTRYQNFTTHLRVLQINASYKPAFIYGGPTMSVSGLSEQLAKSGCLIKVFTTTANGQAELPVVNDKELIVDGVEVRYFKRITKDHSHFSPALPLALWKEARSFDVIHIHAWWNLVSMLACLVAIWRKVPVVLSPRGTLSRYSFQHKNASIKSVFHNLIGKPLLKRCHFHVTSGREENAIKEILTQVTRAFSC